MGTTPITERGPGVRVIASASTWIEGAALAQLDETSKLPGMRRTVGMPDLHPGKGSPVGAAFLSEGIVHPSLVGSDIGCGMALWRTDLPARKLKPERLAERLEGLDAPWDGDAVAWLAARDLAPTGHETALGTVGHGNHFAEIQSVHAVLDAEAFAALGLDAGRAMLLVHTGSRGFGEAVLRAHAARHGAEGLAAGTPEADAYLRAHDTAVRWAEANRDLVAHRMLAAVGGDGERALDVCHNSVTAALVNGCRCWLHRKGAAPADRGPVVIPGSRGDASYLVTPVPDRDDALWSLAHGAGRKLPRHEARAKLRDRFRREDLLRTPYGGRVVCGDDALLWEEAPAAYKSVESVVGDLEAAGLLRIVAVLHPLVTFKVSGEHKKEAARDKAARMRDRKAARMAKRREA
jgi:release factor H-coupled RctB family protein